MGLVGDVAELNDAEASEVSSQENKCEERSQGSMIEDYEDNCESDDIQF